jgi:hypothetical protein
MDLRVFDNLGHEKAQKEQKPQMGLKTDLSIGWIRHDNSIVCQDFYGIGND